MQICPCWHWEELDLSVPHRDQSPKGQHEYEEEKQERDKHHRMTQVSAATWEELQVCTAAGKIINSTAIFKVVCTSWKDKENRTIHFLEMRLRRTWDFQVILSCVWTGRYNNEPLAVSHLHASWVNFRAAGDGLKPAAKWFPRQHFYKGPGILKKCQLLLLGLSPLRSPYQLSLMLVTGIIHTDCSQEQFTLWRRHHEVLAY